MENLGPSQYILEPLQIWQFPESLPSSRTDGPEGAGGPLLGRKAKAFSCAKGVAEKSDLFLKLEEIGYPIESLSSMERCGQVQGLKLLESCDQCGNVRVIDLMHHCNLRTCKRCSQIRKRRIRNQYLPLLNQYTPKGAYALRFLTISPKNYQNLEYGLEDIRKSFKRFLNAKYSEKNKQRIKDRIKGGIYIIESKNKNSSGESNGWNIHIHAIIYSQILDNKIRGKCLDCKQSYVKLDGISKKYYCANRKCNSLNVELKEKDSKIVRIYNKINKTKCNIRINTLNNNEFTLNYLLKYISSNKESFDSIDAQAEYINAIHHRMLLNPFGCFYKIPKIKQKPLCMICKGTVSYTLDMQIVYLLRGNPWPGFDDPPPELEEISMQIQIDQFMSDEGPRPQGAVAPEERPYIWEEIENYIN